jgi:thiol-disulfide isomerase/thioredoxin
MNSVYQKNLLVAAAGLLTVGLALTERKRCSESGGCCPSIVSMTALGAEATTLAATNAQTKARLPLLLDLGADKCIPCKMMVPVLRELAKEYEARLEVQFIDVWKNPDAGKAYTIHLIPTQIFFDASGRELFRHEGFFSKKDILAKWQELGVKLESEDAKPKPESGNGAKK